MKKYKSLSLIVAGFVLGVALSYAPQLEAATTKLLGSKVGNVLSVKIDDRKIGEGAVVNGTTLVPLRVIANEAGMEVVKVDSKEVVLSAPEIPVNDIEKSEDVESINAQISDLNKKIRDAEEVISNKVRTENYINSIRESWDGVDDNRNLKEAKQEQIESVNRMQKALTDAETNLPLYTEQLEELKSKLKN